MKTIITPSREYTAVYFRGLSVGAFYVYGLNCKSPQGALDGGAHLMQKLADYKSFNWTVGRFEEVPNGDLLLVFWVVPLEIKVTPREDFQG